MTRAIRRRPVQREKAVQAQIVQLLRSIGASVYVLGTHRRRGDYQGTMQTPGIPDLMVFTPPDPSSVYQERGMLFIEVKAAGGRLRPAQVEFRDLCEDARTAHIVGGLDEVIAWLIAADFLRADQVPHYRLTRTQRRQEAQS